MSEYYPGSLGQMIVVNAPSAFTMVWAIIKGFYSEDTRNKIKILGSNYMSHLQEHLDDEDIPSFLGGKCECLEHGGCMKSNLGPWQHYEVIFPKGVRRRKHYHPDVNGRPVFCDS